MNYELRKFVAPEYVFGNGARNLAGKYAQNMGAKNILLVTDEVLQKQPWVNDVYSSIQEEKLECIIYNKISPNPRDTEINEGAEVYLRCNCDIIVAIGGGSVIDAAKGIGIVVTNGKPIVEFEGIDKIEVPIPPLICIPTTGGTSADVSQFAIINNLSQRYKMAIISKAVVPDLALIDPETLKSMSLFLTSCTAMDALSHAFEAFVSNANSPFTDLYASKSIDIIINNLPKVLNDHSNIDLHYQIMLGSLYAGLAFSNASLGCLHSLSHSLGGYLDLPHGECNAIMLPHVVEYNFNDCEERYLEIGRIIRVKLNRNLKLAKKELVSWLIDFKREVGIENTLGNYNVTSDILPILARRAIKDPCNATNPKAPTKRDLEVLYSESI